MNTCSLKDWEVARTVRLEKRLLDEYTILLPQGWWGIQQTHKSSEHCSPGTNPCYLRSRLPKKKKSTNNNDNDSG